MNLLIVGAGAVGSVYGYLASGSSPSGEKSTVTYLIKPKNRRNLEDGITLYSWRGKKAETLSFKTFSLVDSLPGVRDLHARKKFDAVLITLPSDKINDVGWLDELFSATAGADLWSLQPHLSAQVFLKNRGEKILGEDFSNRLVWGRIPIMSYLAPLPGEPFEKPGYAFFIPPLSPALWASPNESASKRAADFFSSHGLPSKSVKDFSRKGILPEALLHGIVAGLEISEWSIDKLLNGSNLPLVSEGIREMTAIQAKTLGTSDPGGKWWGRAASSGFGLRKALRAAQWFMPFDFEAFLRVHFTKVESQMHAGILGFTVDGKKYQLSTTNLVLLKGRRART